MWTSVPCPAVHKSRLPLECLRFGVTATTNFIFPRCVLFYFFCNACSRDATLSARVYLRGASRGARKAHKIHLDPPGNCFFLLCLALENLQSVRALCDLKASPFFGCASRPKGKPTKTYLDPPGHTRQQQAPHKVNTRIREISAGGNQSFVDLCPLSSGPQKSVTT